MNFKVLSRLQAEAYTPTGRETCISISDPHYPPPSLRTGFLAMLSLHFDDCGESRSSSEVPISEAQALAIVEFVRSHPNADTLVVHCHAGASRSPAIALAAAEILGDDKAAMRIAKGYPAYNRFVLRRIRQAAGLPGHPGVAPGV